MLNIEQIEARVAEIAALRWQTYDELLRTSESVIDSTPPDFQPILRRLHGLMLGQIKQLIDKNESLSKELLNTQESVQDLIRSAREP